VRGLRFQGPPPRGYCGSSWARQLGLVGRWHGEVTQPDIGQSAARLPDAVHVGGADGGSSEEATTRKKDDAVPLERKESSASQVCFCGKHQLCVSAH
jgi:hypothetical protein